MALKIDTFDNRTGGNSYYKAVSHPLAAKAADRLLSTLRDADSVAIYDPLGYSEGFAAFYPIDDINLCGVFVQDIAKIGDTVLGHRAQAVTDLPGFAMGRVIEPKGLEREPSAETRAVERLVRSTTARDAEARALRRPPRYSLI